MTVETRGPVDLIDRIVAAAEAEARERMMGWRLEPNGAPYNIVTEEGGMPLASFEPMLRAEFEANARLIAVARDLLAIVEAIVYRADREPDFLGRVGWVTVEGMRDALRKAKGGRP
jgi:hypothetical protein